MAIKKNRLLTKDELLWLMHKLLIPLPEKQDANTLFTALADEIKKPPPPPPPGSKKAKV
jgi:hypothetical protein